MNTECNKVAGMDDAERDEALVDYLYRDSLDRGQKDVDKDQLRKEIIGD